MRQIVECYDHFILDVWGVIYNGAYLLPGVLDLFSEIKSQGKTYNILSNAPRYSSTVADRLAKFDLHIPQDLIVTSGGFFMQEAAQKPAKYYVMGMKWNIELSNADGIEIVEDPSKADYILFLAFPDSDEEEELLKKELRQLQSLYQLPFVCPNPDKVVLDGNKLRKCQGYFAAYYASLGGEVMYYGKPYKEIYDYVFRKYNLQDKSVIMVGDSVETDLIGAKNAGIHSLFLLTGIHESERDIAELLNKYKTEPTYVLERLDAKDLFRV